jgi:hypothetical protein
LKLIICQKSGPRPARGVIRRDRAAPRLVAYLLSPGSLARAFPVLMAESTGQPETRIMTAVTVTAGVSGTVTVAVAAAVVPVTRRDSVTFKFHSDDHVPVTCQITNSLQKRGPGGPAGRTGSDPATRLQCTPARPTVTVTGGGPDAAAAPGPHKSSRFTVADPPGGVQQYPSPTHVIITSGHGPRHRWHRDRDRAHGRSQTVTRDSDRPGGAPGVSPTHAGGHGGGPARPRPGHHRQACAGSRGSTRPKPGPGPDDPAARANGEWPQPGAARPSRAAAGRRGPRADAVRITVPLKTSIVISESF